MLISIGKRSHMAWPCCNFHQGLVLNFTIKGVPWPLPEKELSFHLAPEFLCLSQKGGKPALSGPESLPALPDILTGGRDGVCSPNPTAQSHLCTWNLPRGSPHLQVTTSNTSSTSWQSLCFPTSQELFPQLPGQPAGLPW